MITRYRVSFGGVQLDSLDENIAILDVQHTQPDRVVRKITTANLDGYDLGNEKVGQRSVTVSFELHIYDIKERNRVCQVINEWAAAGKTLIVNDRDGQRLENVVCEQFADIHSVRNWTDPLTLVFVTTSCPYWRSVNAVTRTLTGKGVSGTMTLDGNVSSSLVGVEITAAGAINSIQITVGDRVLKLTGISIATGQKVVVDYVKDRYMRIKGNGSSIMAKLDPTSSDLLVAECGKTTSIGVAAYNGSSSVKVTAVFTARGCWR